MLGGGVGGRRCLNGAMNQPPPTWSYYATAMHPTGPATVLAHPLCKARQRAVRAYLLRWHERQARRERKDARSSNDGAKMLKTNAWPGERPAKPECRPEFWTSETAGPAALSAVYAWIMQNPNWLAVWVSPHVTMRWDKGTDRLTSSTVGGHYRRRPGYGKCPHNLAATCKFDRGWSSNSFLEAPFCAARERWGRDGCLIPRDQRQLTWH